MWFIYLLLGVLAIPVTQAIYIDEGLKGSISLQSFQPKDVLFLYTTLYRHINNTNQVFGEHPQMYLDFAIFNGLPCFLEYNETEASPLELGKNIYGYAVIEVSLTSTSSDYKFRGISNSSPFLVFIWTNFNETETRVAKALNDGERLLAQRTIDDLMKPISELQNPDSQFDIKLQSLMKVRYSLNEFRVYAHNIMLGKPIIKTDPDFEKNTAVN